MIKGIQMGACGVALFMATASFAAEGKRLTAREAASHVGETATVCGTVASAKYVVRVKGQPTFLNLDEPYPRQVFTVLIWGSDRAAFGTPEQSYSGKDICVTGRIQSYRGKPEIFARKPAQIKVEKNQRQ